MEALKTGVIYDPFMLEHKARRKHPQIPQRIKVIIDMLYQKKVLSHPRVQYLPSISREAQESELKLAHPQKYISFCRNLWPKFGHRSDITILDTYFNAKSQKIAKMAAGGLLEGIDKLMQGKWQNGFAVIRPPGHHSGAKNTINGFCIYNNVAIGANYLIEKWKKQRVAIIDWDIHHGDGTQHIMQNNSNVLFISIHRYDRGTYYPAGDDGNFHNNGEATAKGTKINIPLDFVDQNYQNYNFQSPGDNQYIYLYHRLIQPVLKKFNPQFILISSGFDAANGDPLGGFTVTPHGYHYMTKKLLEFKKPTLVALQGGYSLDAIANSAYAIVKALLHQQLHDPVMSIHKNQLKQVQLRDLCSIHPLIHNQIDKILQYHSQFWPQLSDPSLVSYTQKIKQNVQKSFSIIQDQSSSDQSQKSDQQTKDIQQFDNDARVQMVHMKKKRSQSKDKTNISKHQKDRTRSKDQKASLSKDKKSKQKNKKKTLKQTTNNVQKILKKQKQQTDQKPKQQDQQSAPQFYFAAGHMQRFKNFSLKNDKIHKWAYEPQINFFQSNFQQKKFAPKYFGSQQKYVIIQNLLYNQREPIIMDIKLSRQSKNPFISQQKQQKQKKKQLKSTADLLAMRISGYTTKDFKQGGIMTYTQQQVKTILRLVVCQANKQIFVQFLNQMIQCFSRIRRKYWGTSIVLIRSQVKSTIRWIDFHYYVQQADDIDHDLIQGLTNLRNFIESIN